MALSKGDIEEFYIMCKEVRWNGNGAYLKRKLDRLASRHEEDSLGRRYQELRDPSCIQSDTTEFIGTIPMSRG